MLHDPERLLDTKSKLKDSLTTWKKWRAGMDSTVRFAHLSNP